jgi:tetratricopeptide (TPR) repeat protein
MKWSSDEKENLVKLLLSVDENNRSLAIELLKTADDTDEYSSALFFLDCCDYYLKDDPDFQNVFNKISEQQRAEWSRKTGFLKSVYSQRKHELNELINVYETEAKAVYDEYFSLAPQYAHIYNTLGNRLVTAGMKAKGLEYLKKAVTFDPESYSNNFDYAFNLNESKKNALTVIKHYKKCIEIMDNGIGPYHNIGRIYAHQLGEFALAAEIMKEGIAKFPYADTMIEIAMAEENMGNLDTARAYLEKAIETQPENALAHNNFAFLLWKYFDAFESAKMHSEKALQLKPKDGLYWHTLAEVEWYGFKNRERALEALYKGKEVQKSYKGGDEMIRELEA